MACSSIWFGKPDMSMISSQQNMVIFTPLMALVDFLPMPSPQALALEEMLILMMMRTSLSAQIPVSLFSFTH